MGYGGPRVAFYTQNQYDNHTASIKKENNARVRALYERDQWPAQEAEYAKRLEEVREAEKTKAEAAVREREEFEAAAAKRARAAAKRNDAGISFTSDGRVRTAAEMAAIRARTARLAEIAKPKKCPDAMHGAGTYGCVMQPAPHHLVYPQGRNGAVYMPGVDRDRRVPQRPNLSCGAAPPPWVGSYSTHHGAASQQAKALREEQAYYLGAGDHDGDAELRKSKNAMVNTIALRQAEERAAEAKRLRGGADDDEKDNAQSVNTYATDCEQVHSDDDDDDSDVPSVFSHGSSLGPIVATGAPHMMWTSTKPEVSRHLQLYGGAMTAPAPKKEPITPASELTLPELSVRIVRMQVPSVGLKPAM